MENAAAMDHAGKHTAGDIKRHHLLARQTQVWLERYKQMPLEWFGITVTKPQGWDVLPVRQLQQQDQSSSALSIPSRLVAHAQTYHVAPLAIQGNPIPLHRYQRAIIKRSSTACRNKEAGGGTQECAAVCVHGECILLEQHTSQHLALGIS